MAHPMKMLWISCCSALMLSACGNGEEEEELDCTGAPTLPASISQDTTVGPGCVVLQETTVENDAQLTIEPGTTLVVEPAGYLRMSRALTAPGDGGRLIAVGTDSDPIVFTSDSTSPAPGDWGCVFFGSDAAGSEMQHVIVEYGGAPCNASGGGPDTQILVTSQIKAMNHVTSQHSDNHGVMLLKDANVRSFENNLFRNNGAASIWLDANQIVVPGDTNVFETPGDYIEIETGAMNRDGTISKQPVPYRFGGAAVVGNNGKPTLEVAAGVRFELESANFYVEAGNMVVNGTASDPVVFTSAKDTPADNDWGCLWYAGSSLSTGTPTVTHARFEYASGPGCGNNNNWDTALAVPTSSDLTSLTFENIDGHAIFVPLSGACPTDACSHTFISVAKEPLNCGSGPQTCP